ncbi:LPXTG cell wall anchor domain-containing protein [Candidatus Saccharibacteria bacterium]|nr:LPXTG cell wall anchor domain-containing protein [Candidatus Saccharibacteria bacterium]
MYDNAPIVGGMGAGAATAAVTVLPSTGASILQPLALSVLAGMLTWGILYARKQRQNQTR